MSRVRILTDSTADVPADLARRLGITVVPAYVHMDGRSLRDGDQITRAEFYRRLPELSEIPTTAVPSVHEFAAAFLSLVGQAEEVIAILVSTTLSGMLNAARLGSQEVPELKVHLVDSRQLMMGLGWQVIIAAEAAAEGLGAGEILARIREIQPRVRILGLLDTLEHLRRSGRVAWARAVAAQILRIKPLIEFRQGEAVLVGQARTRRKAIQRLLEMIAALGPLERLAVIHAAAPDVEPFRARLGALFPGQQILVSEIGPTVGTHLGPRALGIAAIVAA
ncbi:MAG TPA: DegV family protein [Anaerolineales bacterium]|nr:DegV family protein [Anaerolineae bacterium]HIQ01700.1 DegV family protein [Anaerolineales bacterium]